MTLTCTRSQWNTKLNCIIILQSFNLTSWLRFQQDMLTSFPLSPILQGDLGWLEDLKSSHLHHLPAQVVCSGQTIGVIKPDSGVKNRYYWDRTYITCYHWMMWNVGVTRWQRTSASRIRGFWVLSFSSPKSGQEVLHWNWAILVLLWANSPFSDTLLVSMYFNFLHSLHLLKNNAALCRQLTNTWVFCRYLENKSVGDTCGCLAAFDRLDSSQTAIIFLTLVLLKQIARN